MEEIDKSPLFLMAKNTPTQYWNDSCSIEELTYAIERGAVGATSNPTIVLNVLKKELLYMGRPYPKGHSRQSGLE
jgi:transaldolase